MKETETQRDIFPAVNFGRQRSAKVLIEQTGIYILDILSGDGTTFLLQLDHLADEISVLHEHRHLVQLRWRRGITKQIPCK